jgi:hypothetical protein
MAQQKVGGVNDRNIEYQYMLCSLGASLLGEVLVAMPIRELHMVVTRGVPVVEDYTGHRHKYMHYAQVQSRAICNSSNSGS